MHTAMSSASIPQIYSNTGGFQGVSFAIPIEVATHVQDSILKTGKVNMRDWAS